MSEEKEKVIKEIQIPNPTKTDVEETKDEERHLTDEEKNNLRENAKEIAMDEFGVHEKELALFKEALEEAKKPIVLKDSDIEIGEGETDIRKLSSANYRQIMFRIEMNKLATIRSLDQSLVDTMRLLMLVLKKLGVEDITQDLDNLYEELGKYVKRDVKKDLN